MIDYSEENDNPAANHQGDQPSIPHCDSDYLAAAREAYASGNHVLAMHLYMSAYEEGCRTAPLPDMNAIGALREAWQVACELKERSIAEYVFEKLEPHLSAQEAQKYAHQLQGLTLDKLSEFGISRADLEDMAEMISDEIGATAHIAKITPVASTHIPAPSQEGEDASEPMRLKLLGGMGKAGGEQKTQPRQEPRMGYADLVGFDQVIEDARALGLGVKEDEEFHELIETLRAQHGLDGLSAAGSVIFRTSSREDAGTFMTALAGELNLPAMRVQMQSGPQGMPMLCVSMSSDQRMRANGRAALASPGVLVLEDIDLWGESLIQAASAAEGEGIMFASMARAAREAVALIGSAVANPDVYVLASVAGDSFDQGFLYEMLEPMSIIDIYMPDETERRQLWDRMAQDHPSLRELDLSQLVRLTRNMSRFDIVCAGRESVEDAYRQSLRARAYAPVTQSMVYEHISNFQPLESEEYHFLEDAVARYFRDGIDELEMLICQEAAVEENPEALPCAQDDMPESGDTAWN